MYHLLCSVRLPRDSALPGATTAEEDIGAVVSRVLDDPRAVDKVVVIKVNTLTQNEIIDTWERLSGKKAISSHFFFACIS